MEYKIYVCITYILTHINCGFIYKLALIWLTDLYTGLHVGEFMTGGQPVSTGV